MEKNEQIKQTLLETRERRKSQSIRVFELKVNCHHTSKEDFRRFDDIFRQAKWVINDVIASEDCFKYSYKEHRIVTNFDKDGNLIERKITIQTGVHQNIISHVQQDIVNLSKSKKRGNHVGRLRFRSVCNRIPLKTGMLKIKAKSTVSIPMFPKLRVYGLEQFINIPDFEIANADIIKKASGIYLKVSVYTPKKQDSPNSRSIGLDFGVKTALITSEGDSYICNKRESEYLKFLQRQLHRKQKNSKRYWRLRNQIQKEYEHLANQKKDIANKTLSKLQKENGIIYFQDEQISKWRKKKRFKRSRKTVFSFGKQIQASFLGRIKAKLLRLEKDGNAFMISKWVPTTKYCPNCGNLNTLTLSDRIYTCSCGYSCDRDIHSARNVKLFGSTKRAECLEQASAEALASDSSDFNSENQAIPMKRKQETHTF